jgi:hypothetical protein
MASPFKGVKKYGAAVNASVVGHIQSKPQTTVKRDYGQLNQGKGYKVVK